MKEVTYKEYRELSCEEQDNFTGIINSKDGSQVYYQNGNLHREDGPAVEYSDGYVGYWINGKLHRIDGPAVIHSNGHIGYWINGERVSKEAQELYHSLMKLKGLI